MKLRKSLLFILLALPLLFVSAQQQQQPGGQSRGGRSSEEYIKLLESERRIDGLQVDKVVEALKVRPDDRVCDLGAGSGLFTRPLARKAGGKGVVYAVDIDKGLLEHISERAKSLGIGNIKTVLGTFTDPSLPVKNVDVALINDVLHHIEARGEYLKNLARYLGPGGRIAVVDFKPGQGGHAKQPEQQISKEQAAEWMNAAGLKVAEDVDLFPDKWFVIYSR